MNTTEMRMLRCVWTIGRKWLDYVRNVDIWKETQIAKFLREKRLRWFEHVRRQDGEVCMRTILQMVVNGEKSRETNAEMARPGERGYDQKPTDNRDGRREKTCRDSSRDTSKYINR